MEMLSELAKYMNGWPLWMQGVIGVVFLAKMVTIITPTQVDDAWFGKATPFINGALKMMNVGGLNILKDKNADEKLHDSVKSFKGK